MKRVHNREEKEMNQKGLITRFGEMLDQYRAERRVAAQAQMPSRHAGRLRHLLPTPGNVIFTLAMIALLVAAQSAGALPLANPKSAIPNSQSTIAYQGRLADANGNPLTGTYNMIFRLYAVPTGGAPLWEEQWTGSNGVRVSDGLFNVMLGSLAPIQQSVIAGHDQLWLGITVGTDDEMTPRVQLGSVPFAVQALTVPDGSITTAKIADGAVTQAKLGSDVSLVPPDGSITTAKIADGAVTTTKIANGAVTQDKAPSLIRSLNGDGQVILIGNQVYPGTDSQGFVTISYPCFPNWPSVFLVFNGHWDANQIWPVGHNGPGKCSTRVKMSAPTNAPFRVNWIAVGY